MSKLPLFEDFIPAGFGIDTGQSTYSLGASPDFNTGYNMSAVVGPISELVNSAIEQSFLYEKDSDPSHTAESYIKEVKKYVNNKIDEAYESYLANESTITEANDTDYNPDAHAERLKRRELQNIQRYRAAQDRGDNYAIALYELKIKMDKIDLEKLKVLTAIDDLKEKFGKKNN
jgi:hypothetical protein